MGYTAYVIRRRHTGEVRYVGITTGRPLKRWNDHQKSQSTSSAVVRAFRKYGVEAFNFEVVASAFDRQSLCDLEVLLIAQYGTLAPAGYNLTTGGDGAFERSAETRAKMRLSNSRVMTPAARAKLSAAKTGQPLTAEHKAKVGRPGRPQTPELRAKRAAAQVGRVVSAETRAKIGAANTGRTFSRPAETIEADSARMLAFHAAQTREQRVERMRPAFSSRTNLKSK